MPYIANITNGKLDLKNKERFLNSETIDAEFVERTRFESTSFVKGVKLIFIDEVNNATCKTKLAGAGEIIGLRVEESKLTEYEIKHNNERIEKGKKPYKYYNHIVEVHKEKQFSIYEELDDFAYSLQKVTRYSRPIRNFFHTKTQISEIDYITLINDYIYTERTVFGNLINSLPYQNLLEFRIIAIAEFGLQYFKKTPYDRGLKLLNKYIDGRILGLGKYLVESKKVLEKSFNEIIPDIHEIGFFSENIDALEGNLISISNQELAPQKKGILSNNLFKQAQEFETLFEMRPAIDSLINAHESLKDSILIETHFNKVFRTIDWPLDYRI